MLIAPRGDKSRGLVPETQIAIIRITGNLLELLSHPRLVEEEEGTAEDAHHSSKPQYHDYRSGPAQITKEPCSKVSLLIDYWGIVGLGRTFDNVVWTGANT